MSYRSPLEARLADRRSSTLWSPKSWTAAVLAEIMPFIQEFYARMPMPDPLQLIAMQGLLRGPLFVVLLYMVLGVTRAGRVEAIWMAGAALSIIGGIAPLIVPNPFFPDAIRWAHFVEVGISNFVYGSFVGWLLTRPVGEERARQLAKA